MEKKNLKWYEAPEMALVDVELQGMVCLSPGEGGGSANLEVEPGFGS